MPEPMPYYPPGAIPPTAHSSYTFYTPSSSGPPSLTHRTTASSTMSSNSSRHHMQYSNGFRSTADGEKTPISSNEYPSHASNTSNFTERSSGNYLSNTTEDDEYRPSGAFPPSTSSAHSSTSYSSQSLFNPYASERLQDANGYQHQEPLHDHLHRVASYSSQPFKPAPPLPPLPPPKHTTSSNEHHIDSSAKYVDARQASPSVDTSLCMSSSI